MGSEILCYTQIADIFVCCIREFIRITILYSYWCLTLYFFHRDAVCLSLGYIAKSIHIEVTIGSITGVVCKFCAKYRIAYVTCVIDIYIGCLVLVYDGDTLEAA